jgi:heme exporter protein D
MDEIECGYLGFISTTDAGLQVFFAVVLTTVVVVLAASLVGSVSTKNRLARELAKEKETNEQKQKSTTK